MQGLFLNRRAAELSVVVLLILAASCVAGGRYLSVTEGSVLPQAPDRTQVVLLSCNVNIQVVAVDGVEIAKMSPPQTDSWCGSGRYLVLKPGRAEIRVRAPRAREDGTIQRGVANVRFTAEAGTEYHMGVGMTVLSISMTGGRTEAGDALFNLIVKEVGTEKDVSARVSWVSG